MRSSLAATACVVLASLGCNSAPTGPPPEKELTDAVVKLERQVHEIYSAFDSGAPKLADKALHRLPAAFSTIKRTADPAGLSDSQQTALENASDKLLDALAELHGPMHNEVFPEDFDFEPIRERLQEGVAAMRDALPAEIAEAVERAAASRAATEAAEGVGADDPGPLLEEIPDDGLDAEDESPAVEEAEPAPNAARGAPAAGLAAVAPLCPSVMLWDEASLRLAPERVNRVAELLEGVPPDRRWVQLVPTLHARLRPDLTVEGYGLMRDRDASWTDAENIEPASDALADRFRDAFAAAFRQAVRRGLHVAVLPHLDAAGGPVVEWRNLYDFAPDEVIGAGSYESLLLTPIADAIQAEVASTTRVDFALAGEMGRSVFEHPSEYLNVLKRYRTRFVSEPRTIGIRFGLALDWQNLDGQAQHANDASERELLASCDFLGVSCYAPVSVPPTADDFTAAVRGFLDHLEEMSGYTPLSQQAIVLSEVGLGGGVPGKSSSVQELAANPAGGEGVSTTAWRLDEHRAFRRQYHDALCDYLAGADRVEKAFLWSEGPWDPQGVTDQASPDEPIAELIARHNRR